MLRKIKIRTRLILMFAFLMAALLIVVYSDVASRVNQISDTEFLKKNYIDHLEMLADVNVTTGNLFLSYRNYYLEYPDEEKMQVRLTDINNRSDFILTKLQAYHAFLTEINAPQADLGNVADAIATIQNEVLPFNRELIGLMQAGQIETVHSLIVSKELRSLRSSLQDELITKIYNDCVENAVTVLDSNVSEMNAANIRMIILVAVGLIFVLTFSILVIRSVTTPIHNLMQVSKEIALGNVHVNLPPIANDEIGELTAQFGEVTNVLNTLMREMNETAQQHTLGDMDARIDESHFKGAYQEVAVGINQMVGGYIQHVLDLLGCLNQFGDGNFDVSYAPLPGKKASLNTSVEDLRKNLKNISRAIDGLAQNARNGQLSMRADADSFQGDWKKLLVGLNLLMDSIIAPINEASAVLQQVAEGNFNQKVEGHYQGDFKLIANAINNTVTNVASYITEIAKVLTALADDDLTQTITRTYVGQFTAIKDALNLITDKFNRIMSDILAAAEQVAAGARQVSESSMILAQGATQQASAVEELNATVLTINESTTHNFDNAKAAETLSGTSKDNALQGDQDMKEMLNSMEGINNSSNNIAKIIKTIDGIAFQTNLLALNAAVEAARAGEHGKGFAVVAEEVRSLAGRSQNAAKDTERLIEESIQSVNQGSKVADLTATALRTIVGDAAKVSEIITNIAHDSQKQVEAIGQVSFGITQISEVVQSNSATSEETASASEELSSQAEILRALVSVFKLK